MTLPLAISVGDPAGVGPEVSLVALRDELGEDGAVVFGDVARLAARCDDLRLSSRVISHEVLAHTLRATPLTAGEVALVHVAEWPDAMIDARAPTVAGGRAQLAALDAAFESVRDGVCRALVTAPISKAAVTMGGTAFAGHTEHLAVRSGLDADSVTMLFLGSKLRVGLVTTHVPLGAVPNEVTAARVRRTVTHLCDALARWMPEATPLRVLTVGVNPHAGEGGLFGREEIDVIEPVLRALTNARAVDPRCVLEGPLPAEYAFRRAAAGTAEGVVAMYHDQGTIASKLLDWGDAVNVTWGLPFVRTSVDHGVAYDAARTRTADASGMKSALRAAKRLTAG